MAKRRQYISKPDAFYILAVLVPLEEMIADVNGSFSFRLDYLDAKLSAYMKTAAETLGCSAALVLEDLNKPQVKNEYAREYYSTRFGQMLEFFKKQK